MIFFLLKKTQIKYLIKLNKFLSINIFKKINLIKIELKK